MITKYLLSPPQKQQRYILPPVFFQYTNVVRDSEKANPDTENKVLQRKQKYAKTGIRTVTCIVSIFQVQKEEASEMLSAYTRYIYTLLIVSKASIVVEGLLGGTFRVDHPLFNTGVPRE